MGVTVEVASDVICPWCFVGKRRLERAAGLLAGRHAVMVAWRPFRLNPGMPRGGMDRRAYRTARFGSWERSLALEARVAEVGRAEGIAFAFDRIARTPNTLDAHRLLWLAGREGPQDALAEALFRAYFCEGRDIGDHEVLKAVAAKAGLDAGRIARLLAGEEGVAEVLAEEGQARRLGIDAVPAFLVAGRPALSGAQPAETLAAAIEQAEAALDAGGAEGSGRGGGRSG
jgi:predicted DsbA family dithiol-disulfide isomerase